MRGTGFAGSLREYIACTHACTVCPFSCKRPYYKNLEIIEEKSYFRNALKNPTGSLVNAALTCNVISAFTRFTPPR